MRIITGTARGIQLDTLEGLETRPTSDRVKEALFSMVQFDIEGRKVLDLFGGSGQLGLEALSRGAEKATIIDANREAVEIIIGNAKKTKLFDRCRISCSDFKNFLKFSSGDKYGLIFLDPPYASSYMHESLELIASEGLLQDGGIIACETEVPEEDRTKHRKKLSKAEMKEQAEIEVNEKVFGGNEELKNIYRIVKTNEYGRTRLTILEKNDD